MRRVDILVTSIACLVGITASATPLQLELTTAWDGWSRPGRVTETALRLQSQNRVTAEVTITSGGQVIHSTVQLAVGESTRLAVPVQANERIVVGVSPAGMNPQTHATGLSLSEAPLLAWVAHGVPAHPMGGFHVVEVDPVTLPDNAAAYSSIDALVINRSAIGAITERQLAALLSFMAGCGRIVLISDIPAPAGLLQGAVGCGGRNFAEVAAADSAIASMDRMLASNAVELPHAATLGTLGGHDLDAWYLAVAVLAVGVTAMALTGIFFASLTAAVLVPALATVASLWLLHSRPVDSHLLVWAETHSNDRLAQYRGVQRATATRRGDLDVPMLAVLAAPQACRFGGPTAWSWDAREQRFAAVRFAGHLFAASSLCYSGSFPVTRNAVAQASVQGRVDLRNSGQSAWPAGMLIWNGRLQATPTLAPGGELALRTEPRGQPVTAAERLALARTPLNGLALLWPLDLRSVNPAPPGAQAWLFLRVGIEPERLR